MGLDQCIYDTTTGKEIAYFRKCYVLQEYVVNNCESLSGEVYKMVHALTPKDMTGVLLNMCDSLHDTLETLDNMDEILIEILGLKYKREHGEYAVWMREFEDDLYKFKRMIETLWEMINNPSHKYEITHSW